MINNFEVSPANFRNLLIVTELFTFDDRRVIQKLREDYFQAKIVINPLFQ